MPGKKKVSISSCVSYVRIDFFVASWATPLEGAPLLNFKPPSRLHNTSSPPFWPRGPLDSFTQYYSVLHTTTYHLPLADYPLH